MLSLTQLVLSVDMHSDKLGFIGRRTSPGISCHGLSKERVDLLHHDLQRARAEAQ